MKVFRECWQWANEQMIVLVTIQITIWIQGLFSRFVFVTTGKYGKWYQPTALCDAACTSRHCHSIATMMSLRHRPLAEVCTVPVLLVTAALWNTAAYYILAQRFLLLSFFFFFPRLDVYHTSTHGVALVKI